ncbi:MAG: hypothetical protein KGQ60_02295, partial [Planctomycetes bacterium]|nr:hypothetical protein [Planctomycetota bacterium]
MNRHRIERTDDRWCGPIDRDVRSHAVFAIGIANAVHQRTLMMLNRSIRRGEVHIQGQSGEELATEREIGEIFLI